MFSTQEFKSDLFKNIYLYVQKGIKNIYKIYNFLYISKKQLKHKKYASCTKNKIF